MAKKRKKILLVDDSIFFQATIKNLLERGGYDVMVASNGETALQRAKETLPRIDLAIVDLLLPKMSGFDLIKEIRKLKHGKLLPIIAITSLYHRESHLEILREAKTSGYLEKSTPPEELLYHINALLYPEKHNVRKNIRIIVHFPVRFRVLLSLFNAFSYTLSEGGIFIRSTKTFPADTRLEMAFNLPGDEHQIIAEGKIVHVQQNLDFYMSPPGMGVRFTKISPKDVRRIRAFIEREMWENQP